VETSSLPQTTTPAVEEEPTNPSPSETGDDWKWEMASLDKGSSWYRARMRTLKQAIKEAVLTNEKHWVHEGKKALD
jgi:hypothetical protein